MQKDPLPLADANIESHLDALPSLSSSSPSRKVARLRLELEALQLAQARFEAEAEALARAAAEAVVRTEQARMKDGESEECGRKEVEEATE